MISVAPVAAVRAYGVLGCLSGRSRHSSPLPSQWAIIFAVVVAVLSARTQGCIGHTCRQ